MDWDNRALREERDPKPRDNGPSRAGRGVEDTTTRDTRFPGWGNGMGVMSWDKQFPGVV